MIAQPNGDGPAAISRGISGANGERTFRSPWLGFEQDNTLKHTGSFRVLYNFRLETDGKTLLGAYRVDALGAQGAPIFSFSGKPTCSRLTIENFDVVP